VPSAVHTTRAFTALQYRFRVASEDAAIARSLDELFVGLARDDASDGAMHEFLVTDTGRRDEQRFELALDGVRIGTNSAVPYAVDALLWHLNRLAVASASEGHVVVHAAAAAMSGRTLVLPGAMEAGKSTLVGALMCAGLMYLTDEATAFDRTTHQILPYAKPLTIERGSFPVLADVAPQVAERFARADRWLVPTPAPPASGFCATAIVTPSYQPGAATELVPMRRAEMVALMAEGLLAQPVTRADLDLLSAVVSSTHCYRLTVGGPLEGAVEALLELLERPADEPFEASCGSRGILRRD
jgi:hypothetical protein